MGGHLNRYGDIGVSTDLLPGGFMCIPHTWKTKAKPKTMLGIWFLHLVSSVVLLPWKTPLFVVLGAFFFSLSRFLFVPVWLLISDGNGKNEMMASSECSRCPQT